MKYKIKAGRHRAWPPCVKAYVNRKVISCQVTFSKGCAYSIAGEDQNDTNKLFGIGYVPWWKMPLVFLAGAFGSALINNEHHNDSARFGWRYDTVLQKIVVSAYCYVAGVRKITELVSIPVGETIRCSIRIEKDHYIFHVYGVNILQRHVVPFSHKKTLGYRLGVYFGGNKVAPNDMEIIMTS